MLIRGRDAPFFCVRFDLGLLLGLLFRVTPLWSLGLLLGLLFRFFECTSEVGNLYQNANKCRFSTFSERKTTLILRSLLIIYGWICLINSDFRQFSCPDDLKKGVRAPVLCRVCGYSRRTRPRTRATPWNWLFDSSNGG